MIAQNLERKIEKVEIKFEVNKKLRGQNVNRNSYCSKNSKVITIYLIIITVIIKIIVKMTVILNNDNNNNNNNNNNK